MGKKTKKKQEDLVLQTENIKKSLVLMTKQIKEKLNEKEYPIKDCLIGYKSFFIKDIDSYSMKLKTKDRQKQLLDLVRFVFNKYNVPNFLLSCWNVEELEYEKTAVLKTKNLNLSDIAKNKKYRDWYICVARGGSLHKEYLKDILTKKETHLFLSCKHQVSIEESLVYSICKSEGVNDGMALRIAKSKLNEKGLSDFWKGVIKFFARELPTSIKEINDLVDYISFKKNENKNFNIVGLGYTLKSLNKKMIDWHYDLRRLKAIGEAYWDGHPIDNQIFKRKDQEGKDIVWYFSQIKSAKELQQEGNAQRHCVLSYKDRCISGECSIWSVVYEDSHGHKSRKLTIELRNSGDVVQIRGFANRSAKVNELAIVSHWAKENNLYLRKNAYSW